MNTIGLTGRLGKDVELKNIGGTALAEFSVGETVGFGDRKVTNWWKCQIWGKQAESGIIDYLQKGKQVHISGEITLREFESNGAKRLSPEIRVDRINLIGDKADKPVQQKPANDHKPYGNGQQNNDLDDDLPF